MAGKGLGGVAFKSGRHKGMHKSEVCAGLNKTGKNKGRLKKGYKFTGTGACPVPASSDSSTPKKKAAKKSAPKRKSSSKKKSDTGPNFAKLCAGLHTGGKKKGKLKKGFKWKPGVKCPVTAKTK